ncbi:site-2 protease family protein [Nocardia inohanensis]|uniref:site-2 protease family protein n=1 Tax=Nocardia inohanensis TaxID=209246 RepID=UPI00083590B0|nr:site-2 protease family protein [Nocardia inohanensis]
MFEATIPLGRIAGVRLRAHWTALITIGLLTWLLAASLSGTGDPLAVWLSAGLGATALLGCLLAHELAHSIVARRAGVRVHGIVLWLLGGLSELAEEPRDPKSDLRIALAGPVTSVALAVAAGAAAGLSGRIAPDGPVTAVLVWLATVNLVLAVFNLLPGAPLDGGRVVRAVLWWRTGDRLRAEATAARWGRLLGATLMLLGIAEVIVLGQFGGLWLILLGWFLRNTAAEEMVVAGLRHRLGDTTVRDLMTPSPIAVAADWRLPDLLASPAACSRHRVFPVVDAEGRPVAVLAWSDLSALPAGRRTEAHLGEVARKLPRAAITTAAERLSDLMCRIVLRPNLDAAVVVDEYGRLTGILTATDLILAADRSALSLPVALPAHDTAAG